MATGGLKIFTAGVGAAAAGVTALGTTAVKSYAEFEQLVGGVETLFKDSAEIVSKYADNAYKTAGLSANAYMETVTSFSASLLQGLGGDTEQAAEIANLAITDMSDNANKMGTDMTLIQNAYQGFAKQNYTMLDNLKLGYGGTQAEMIRLINDSGILEETIDSLDNVTFDQMIQAIHEVQTNMGITGTTAKEASTTIEGSINSAKAAWSNLVVGIADDNQDFDVLVNNFVESVATAANNLIPRIEIAITGIGKLIEELLPVIVDKIPVIINDILPDLVESGINIVDALVKGFVDNLPILAEAAGKIVDIILEGIGDLCPALKPVTDALQTLIDNFDTVLAVIIPLTAAFVAYKAALAISSIISGVTSAMNGMTIAQYALNLAMSLNPIGIIVALIAALVAAFIYLWNTSDSFRQFWIDLWENIKTFCSDALNAIILFFTETIPAFIQSVVDWFMELPDRLAEWGENVKETVSNAVSEMIDNVITFFSELPENMAYWLGYGITKLILWGIDLVANGKKAASDFIDNVIAFFTTLPSRVSEWLTSTIQNVGTWAVNMAANAKKTGQGFIDGVIEYVKELPGKIWNWFTTTINKVVAFKTSLMLRATEAAVGFVKNIVDGINSLPDKMKEIGSNIVSGIWNGIQNGWDWLTSKVKSLADNLFKGVCDALDIHSPSRKFKWIGEMCVAGFDDGAEDLGNMDGIQKNISASLDSMKMSVSGGNLAGGNTTSYGDTNIVIQQPVKTPSETARAIRMEMQYGLAGA
ncbi:MAG: hypothetical protein ACI4ES_12095 [Roseburia sp.]